MIIEKLLEQKSQGTNGEVFNTQWKAAKAYIPKILETISHVFPHYSLHNESHSINILSNIVRMLGIKVLEKFSVGDLWLLLSAAYYHDLGMAVSAKDKEQWLDCSDDYKQYIEQILSNNKDPHYEYALIYEIRDGKLYFRQSQATSRNFDSTRYLLANFVRSKHADRSANIIPDLELATAFRDDIPKRLFMMLAKVCATHNLDREKILDLPYEESTGFDADVCHPRYIAALLRIGDLLDVDNNRISDVLISSVCNIPEESLAYNQTNRDIEHISITPQRLELLARCTDYETANFMQSWFDWIKQEFAFQMSKWSDIVPSSDYGSLPMIGQLDVILEGYETLGSGIVPRFSLNKDKVFELLQGHGLYSHKEVFVRELLQNAIDAIILRLRIEDRLGQTYEEFKAACKQYGRIDFKLFQEDKNRGGRWICEISDNGVGMKKSHLAYLFEVASSYKNEEKCRVINEMPQWMRPSGTFGIGFQSVFLVTDEVEIETRHHYGQYTYDVHMFNPVKSRDKAVYVKSHEGGNFGTKIRFAIDTAPLGKIEIPGNQVNANFFVENFDFAKQDFSDILVKKALDEALNVATLAHVDIHVEYEGRQIDTEESPLDVYFDEPTQMGLSIRNDLREPFCFYRNMPLQERLPRFDNLPLYVNILSSNSKEILTAERNKIRSEYQSKILHDFDDAVARFLSQKTYYSQLDDLRKRTVSLRLKANHVIGDSTDINNDWKEIGKAFEDPNRKGIVYNLKSILSHDRLVFYNGILRIRQDNTYYYMVSERDPHLAYTWGCMYRLIGETFPYVMLEGKRIICSKHKEDCPTLVKANKKSYLYILELLDKPIQKVRRYMPCSDAYKVLAIEENSISIDEPILGFLQKNTPIMVSPFVLGRSDKKMLYDVDESVINYVYARRVDKSVTREQIEAGYNQIRIDYQDALDEYNRK